MFDGASEKTKKESHSVGHKRGEVRQVGATLDYCVKWRHKDSDGL